MKYFNKKNIQFVLATVLFIALFFINADYLKGAAAKWIAIGDLKNFYQEHGCEPEEDFGDQQQFGLQWHQFYPRQDNQAAKGFWIGVKNYDDPIGGKTFSHKVVHCGPRPRPTIEEDEMMPIPFPSSGTGLKMYGRIPHPQVYVDGAPASDLRYDDVVEVIDPDLPSDRMLVNKIHTEVGIDVTRKIYAYSHDDYDDFHIMEYTFKNTGICSQDETVTHNQTLEDVYFHWQFRYAVCKEGTVEGTGINFRGDPGWGTIRDMRWGINTMNEVIGEHPNNPREESVYPTDNLLNKQGFGEAEYFNNEVMRAFYSWHGKHSETAYDNIGSPNVNGYRADGRLGAYQFVGVVTLHADKSASDHGDDLDQPATAIKIESNAQATTNNSQWNEDRMKSEYEQYCSYGYPEKSQAEQVGGGYANQSAGVGGGGFSQAIAYGPYTLEPGDSVKIVWAEAAGGLDRETAHHVGRQWYKVTQEGQKVNVNMPDPSDPSNIISKTIEGESAANEYKNAWVYSGKDSLLKTYKAALDLYRNKNLDLDDQYPPDPPANFMVESQGNRILLKWTEESETHPRFQGYKIFRAKGSMDSNYVEIADLNVTDGSLNEHKVSGADLPLQFSDKTAIRGQVYYYYITAYDDGSTTIDGKPIKSAPYWTRTNTGAHLLKPPSETLKDIRVVPNPFNIRNRNIQFSGEYNKIMFLNLPAACRIKIFTERGDLIKTINHEGSGDARWDLVTSSRQIVVSGVYIAHFEVPENIYDENTGELLIKKGTSTFRKFIIIR
ncbi:MAG: hypothetical protein K9N00_00820 [Candidatus Marinimicrobia bacterium]|nr:hypothetical protein [Candidatus Neomarinimicrobiota bacterium]